MMNGGKGIPFVDLVTPHVELQDELVRAAEGVITSAMFIGGPIVEKFERDFAAFCGSQYCVGVASGTDALRFALIAAGIGKGDIVVTVANTFVATIEAIVQAGATPAYVDVDPETSNMSVDSLRAYLRAHAGKGVKAIMPVHLYGQVCDMDPIMDLANEYGLLVFEDACQAHGSEYFSRKHNRWQKAGSIGKAAAFSFYPGKNLGACGEAGAVTTDDEELAKRMRIIRDHGQNKKYYHVVEGYNGRLDALQAALLSVKLPYLKEWNTRRRNAAAAYKELLKDADFLVTPPEPVWSRSNYHLYVVRAQQRDQLQQHFTAHNIGTGLHYPVPLHLQEGYKHLGYRAGAFPVTERLAGELLSLPMFPQLNRSQQERVAEVVVQFSSVQAAS